MSRKKKLIFGFLIGACIGIESLTKNSSAFGHVIAGTSCAFCAILAGKVAYNHYDAVFNAGKNSAQAVHTASKKARETILDNLT